jgi:hypothetical protein
MQEPDERGLGQSRSTAYLPTCNVLAARCGRPGQRTQNTPPPPLPTPCTGNAMLAKGPTGVPQVNIMYNLWTNPAIERTW